MSIFIAIEQCEQKKQGRISDFLGRRGRGFSNIFDFSEIKKGKFKIFWEILGSVCQKRVSQNSTKGDLLCLQGV